MSSNFLYSVPLTKWLLEDYTASHHAKFPGGGKTHYDQILLGVHDYLNEHVHSTLQNRAPLHDAGVYLTDHGPKHIEVVLRRASQLVRSESSTLSLSSRAPFYTPCIDPYEAFLLVLGIHFHDVGNMYGRVGHEQEIGNVMERIGALQPLGFAERHLIARIAMCHGGKFEGDKDTIRMLPAREQHDGEVRYRPQLLAAILRLADELADEHSRADNFGLLIPSELPETCLLFHKYASGLRVSMDASAGQIILHFSLRAEDLRTPFKKARGNTTEDVFLLDEIYERTLKTYTEMLYCGRYARRLDTHLHEVRVDIEIYLDMRNPIAARSFSYTIGDSEYPEPIGSTADTLRKLARGFAVLPDGRTMAEELALQPTQAV